jgi:malate dehydrogenase (quinone)
MNRIMSSLPSNNRPSRDRLYDVVIIGGGVTGTALLYTLAKYTDLKNLALIEKYPGLAAVNSKATNNSQTIHCGDIETNYSLAKALKVKRAAQMLVRYAEKLPTAERESLIYRYPKMVLGVGAAEVELLEARYAQFKPQFAGMQWLNKPDIAEGEPQVARLANGELRPEPLGAIAIRDEYTAMNFGQLCCSFVAQSQELAASDGKTVEVLLGTKVTQIIPTGHDYEVVTPTQRLRARYVVVSAGGHSLWFAQKLGFGLNYSCLPVAGSFYFAPAVLNGKVYTVQNDLLPFAAIHGDPDVTVPGKTRFGPTALPLPLLERYNLRSLGEYLQVLHPDAAVATTLWNLLRVKDIRNYIFKNIAFELPVINRQLFLKEVHKIIPSLALADLSFAQGYGGIRPQLIDKQNRELILGQAAIAGSPGLRFNITPSPGATNCLGNAEQDIVEIQNHLGCRFDRAKFTADLVDPAYALV